MTSILQIKCLKVMVMIHERQSSMTKVAICKVTDPGLTVESSVSPSILKTFQGWSYTFLHLHPTILSIKHTKNDHKGMKKNLTKRSKGHKPWGNKKT